MVPPSIPFCISWLSRLLRTRFDSRARELGLTRAQWSMVAAIRVLDGPTQSELASQLEVKSVTAGRIIDKLEASGWLERRADPADRRANRIYLKEMAQPTLIKLGQIADEEFELATRGMNAEQKAELLSLLNLMLTNLKSAN